jgi:hypothetical protein
MHNLLYDNSSVGTRLRTRLRNRGGFAAMAAILLALGVGVTTAVFALVDRSLPHSAPSVTCETMMDYTSQPSQAMTVNLSGSTELKDRVSEAYETSFEAADDAIGSVPDIAESLSQPLVLSLLGAGALVLLVACTRSASRLVDSPRVAMLAAGTTFGALAFATISLRALALPAIGVRGVVFAGCISLLAVYVARTPRGTSALTGA